MGETTSSVRDEELVEHMRRVLLPFIKETQIPDSEKTSMEGNNLSADQFISGLATSMTNATEGLSTEEVRKRRETNEPCIVRNFMC